MTSAHPTAPPTLAELHRTGRVLTVGTWVLIGAVCTFSAMTGAQFVGAHSPWHWSGWVLAAAIDIAFVTALQADATLARYGSTGGLWPTAFRWLTGAFSVFVNIGDAALNRDPVSVAVHLIAPALLLVLGEAGPAWRRQLVNLEHTTATDTRHEPSGIFLTPSRRSGSVDLVVPSTTPDRPEHPWNDTHRLSARTRHLAHERADQGRSPRPFDTALPSEEARTRPTPHPSEVTTPGPPVRAPGPADRPGVVAWSTYPASAVRTRAKEVHTFESLEQPTMPAQQPTPATEPDADPPVDAQEARYRIVRGRLNGLSQRETARWAHRSPTFVRKVWTSLDDTGRTPQSTSRTITRASQERK